MWILQQKYTSLSTIIPMSKKNYQQYFNSQFFIIFLSQYQQLKSNLVGIEI